MSNPEMPPVKAESSRRALLLVDDEPAIVELLSTVFEVAGFRCLAARDGSEALQLYRENQGDIAAVLTDFNMPQMNGFDLVREIRAISPGAKIILSSGSLGHAEQVVARELGVNALLPKPYNAAQLVSCVRSIIG
jgi:two-component system cell cycle sensor histidine kinase/response regulator CckA